MQCFEPYNYVTNIACLSLEMSPIHVLSSGLGCDFVLESCNNPDTYPYLCNTTVLQQCTFDLVSKV